MELYINPDWTKRYANSYIAEAIAWSENGNHAAIYAVAATGAEADAKLMEAARTQANTRSVHQRGAVAKRARAFTLLKCRKYVEYPVLLPFAIRWTAIPVIP
jgi:hypothetical protein